jgi:hypothetical protein
LELETSRLTLEGLDEILEEDWKRYRSFVERQSRMNPNFRALNILTDQRNADGAVASVRALDATSRIPSNEAAEIFRESVVTSVRRLARSDYFEGEGVPLLNIRQFKTASPAGPIDITGGVNIGQKGQGFSCGFSGTGVHF